MDSCLGGQRGPGELANLQGQHPLSTRTVLAILQKTSFPFFRRQALQKTSIDERGAPDSAQTQKGKHTEAGTTTWKGYRGIVHIYRKGARKAPAQLEPKLAREVKDRKGFLKYINSKRKAK